ncbi:hypothetical protein D3C78_1484870 [compost metagenome]
MYDGIVERQAVFHLAEHIVGSAVQDAFEALYIGTRQGLLGQTNHGRATHHRPLVLESDLVATSQRLEFGTVQRNWALIGGHYMNATFQGPAAKGSRGLTIHRIGESGLSDDVGTGMLDHGFVERLGSAAGQLSECAFLNR